MTSTFDELRQEARDNCQDKVSKPGKYEGEQIYVPWMYGHVLNGHGDVIVSEEDRVNCVTKVRVTELDREVYPELSGMDYIYLHEDNFGFVSEISEEEAERIKNEQV